MLFNEFVSETRRLWTSYLERVAEANKKGLLGVKQPEGGPVGLELVGYKILYPSMLILTECNGYYIAELVGAVTEFKGLIVKQHKEKSINRYFSQFDGSAPEPAIYFDGSMNGVISVCLSQSQDLEKISQRFPCIELYTSKLFRIDGRGSPVGFGQNFESCFLERCVLVNIKDNLYRCKNILYICVVKSSTGRAQLMDLLNCSCENGAIAGVHIAKGNEWRLLVASQLQSMVLFPSLHETTIGEFLKLHPSVLKTVFKSPRIIYEPYLDWIEHDGTCDDLAINPDLLIQRADGFFDIYDLKTALLDKRKVTKNSRKRRGLISYVEEGIAQLANYREYFLYPGNVRLAEEKYSIRVSEPKLVLVVGSWENVDPVEVEQACRKFGASVQIIDYDTICHIFMGAGQ